MLPERQSLHEYFKVLLVTVVGQAFTAAGYHLEQQPLKWAAGQYRFRRPLADGAVATIEFQVLAYTETAHTGRQPSRFRVQLSRSAGSRPALQRSLSALVVSDFGVAVLPAADHWWLFHDTASLGHALAEAGHLTVGYGMPWLAGDLTPGADEADG
ncbi:MAG: hypothetical protein MUE40_00885 [Anaerolineae bacterium]|jgi:hypothetical protein|nr:hypothetical protein [Anaerolineae bacterium]